jgi:hypothetical protein
MPNSGPKRLTRTASSSNTRGSFRVRPLTPGMSNMRPAGRMRPFASTPAARTKDTVIWSFNGQSCSLYNLHWINVRAASRVWPSGQHTCDPYDPRGTLGLTCLPYTTFLGFL